MCSKRKDFMTSLSTLLALLFLALDPFWLAKPPVQWTDIELAQFLTNSPWAQMVPGQNTQPVLAFIATAAPMLQAEEDRERRGKAKRATAKQPEPPENDLAEEYKLWLEDNRLTQIVLAVRIPNAKVFSEDKEIRQMENECMLRVGKNKVRMSGHFPPTTSDPYLRIAFPRGQIRVDDKTLNFDLYLPGVSFPYRHAEFVLRDMVVNGRLEL